MSIVKRNHKRIVLKISIAFIIAVLIFAGFIFMPKKQSNEASEATISTMEELIPYFGTDYNLSTGMGSDPLAVLSIDDVDIVGAIEIPSINLRAPVTDKGIHKKYFATWKSGSPVKGNFRIRGGHNDVFSRLAKGKPGESVVFTDVDGVRYEYTITTQFHLKKWAKADYDLMLCYKVDSETDFVLGCTMQQ